MIANKRSTAEIRDGIAIETHRERKHAGLKGVHNLDFESGGAWEGTWKVNFNQIFIWISVKF